MRIEVRDEAGLGERAVEELRKACRRALRAEGARRDAVLSVVLAFPMREESGEGFILGDIAICPAAVDAWREEYGVESGETLAFVAVHGVLHLLGYEDGDEEGAGRMDRRQREILRLAGGAGWRG